MKFTVIAVGKLKERFWADACAEYVKRLRPYAPTQVVELADDARSGGRDREADAILRAIDARSERARVVLLAIDGTPRSSEDLAAHLEDLALSGTSEVVLVIGGSDGVTQAVRDRADETLSFGPITLPHNLARVVLLEQLYRAQKISRNEPYHK